MNNLYKRVARIEAIANYQKAEFIESMVTAYQNACLSKNADDAATLARKIRNRLLRESDSRMVLDRMGLSVPDSSDFKDWLLFFKEFGDVLTGEWAKYRQKLRDLPEQDGFPFDVVFPIPPDSTDMLEGGYNI